MFRALLCPSSGTRDCNVDYHTGRFVLGLLYVGGKVRLRWSGGIQLVFYSSFYTDVWEIPTPYVISTP